MDMELVTDPDACMTYILSPPAGLGGGILWRPPAYSLLVLLPRDAMRKRGLCCCPVSVRPSVCPSVRHVGGLYPDG